MTTMILGFFSVYNSLTFRPPSNIVDRLHAAAVLRTKFMDVRSRKQDHQHGTDCPKVSVPWQTQLSSENS